MSSDNQKREEGGIVVAMTRGYREGIALIWSINNPYGSRTPENKAWHDGFMQMLRDYTEICVENNKPTEQEKG